MIFKITQNDMLEGTPGDQKCCAIALAVKRDILDKSKLLKGCKLKVDESANIEFYDKDEKCPLYYLEYTNEWISDELADFISYFDCAESEDIEKHSNRYKNKPWEVGCNLKQCRSKYE